MSNQSVKDPGSGKLASVSRFLQFPLGQFWDPRELLFSDSARQEQMSKSFLKLPNHSLALYCLYPLAREGREGRFSEQTSKVNRWSVRWQGPAPLISHWGPPENLLFPCSWSKLGL